MGIKIFDLVTLTLKFDLLLKNFNLGYSFLTRLLYFICTFLVTRPLHMYQNFWPHDLDLEVWPSLKNLNLGLSFLASRGRAFIFHIYAFLVARHSMPCHDFLPSDHDLTGWPTLKKIVLDYDFWNRGITYCCYLHMVAASELLFSFWQLWLS